MRRLTVISLGGGVQSSVMALMAAEGAFDSVPDCAIFADTHWEPPSIYEHLEWLKGKLPFPLHVVDNGRSLRQDVMALTNHSDSPNFVDIPLHLKGRNGEGIGRRQCSTNCKIRPIRRKIREMGRAQAKTAGSRRHCRRAVARNLHRRGSPNEDFQRPVDREPLPADRGGDVSEGLHGLVGGPLRQTAGTLGLRGLSLPVPTEVGGDEASVAWAVRRGGGD